jgi:deoxycytidylate deaminase
MTLLNNTYLIEEATKEAKKSPMKNQYGALLIYRNKIISRGYNKFKGILSKNKSCNNYHDYQLDINNIIGCKILYKSNKYSSHAEQNCIANCKDKYLISKCDMLLLRISHSDDVRPCDMCQHIINKYNVKKLFTISFSK